MLPYWVVCPVYNSTSTPKVALFAVLQCRHKFSEINLFLNEGFRHGGKHDRIRKIMTPEMVNVQKKKCNSFSGSPCK